MDFKIVRRNVYLRKSHAERLAKVDGYLRNNGLYVHLVSGWRHPKLQDLIKELYKKKNGDKKANQLFASTKGKVPAPHTTGAVFDVELRRLSNDQPVEMKLIFNKKKVNSLYWGEELLAENYLQERDEEILKNRRIMYHVLCTSGVVLDAGEVFTAHPGEYWHFGDGDTLSTYLSRKNVIRYGGIYL